MSSNNTRAGSGYGRRPKYETEPRSPFARVEYWLEKVAAVFGVTGTSVHYDLRGGSYEASISVGNRSVKMSVVYGRPGQGIDSCLCQLAWQLQEMIHVS